MWARNEAVLLQRAMGQAESAQEQLADLTVRLHVSDPLVEIQSYLDLAYDYLAAELWEEAIDLLERLETDFPLVLYVLGYCEHQAGRTENGNALYRRASGASPDYCFPVRLEELEILEHVQSLYPEDGRVAYYLGNLLYDKRRYDEAVAQWERATRAEPGFSIAWRNLGIAFYNVRHDSERAVAHYERALAANPSDGRVLAELDQLLGRTGVSATERLVRCTTGRCSRRRRWTICCPGAFTPGRGARGVCGASTSLPCRCLPRRRSMMGRGRKL
jgi:tetratricopeptide (TPR) repeat protein